MSNLQPVEPWLPNGFPPPSFVVDGESVSTFSTSRGRGILIAVALVGAVLLIIGALVIARSGNDTTDVTTKPGTSVSTVPESVTTTSTTELDATATSVDATTQPTAGPTIPLATVTTAPAPATTLAPGILTPSTATLTLPTTFTAKPPVTGTFALKNTGPSPLTFTSATNGGISLAPATGSIAAGGAVTVTVTLNGVGQNEGAYSNQINFGGTGGAKSVAVKSTVANPPTIDQTGVKADGTTRTFVSVSAPNTPCTAGWKVQANVSDQTGIQRVTLQVVGATPVDMTKDAVDAQGRGIWTGPDQPTVPTPGNVKFTITAVDTFGAEFTSAEETVTCP